jgi:hypothetical protein
MKPGLVAMLNKNPTAEEQEIVKLLKALWAFRPTVHDALSPKRKGDVKYLREALKGAITQKAFDSIREVETFPGSTTHILPGRWKKLAGGKLRFFFWGVSSPKNCAKILSGGGLSGINQRLFTGAGGKGSSANTDVNTGCADNLTLRPITANNGSGSLTMGNVTGSIWLIVRPSEADRLDTIINTSDNFGCTNPNHHSHGSGYQKRGTVKGKIGHVGNSSPEVIFRNGIGIASVLRCACASEDRRKEIMSHLRALGTEEINGVPIEDFIVVTSDRSDVYKKYVKPMGF